MDLGADATPPSSDPAVPGALVCVFKFMTTFFCSTLRSFRTITGLLIEPIAPDLCGSVSAVQGHQLSSADVRLFHRGRKQPGESK